MSWHYATDAQDMFYTYNVDGFTLRNIKILNSMGAFTLIAFVNNLTLDKIRVASDSNCPAVGPRDGFHISTNTGTLEINDVDIQGVRMDPIVFRVQYFEITSKTDSTHFRIVNESAAGNIPSITSGSTLGLWSSTGGVYTATVSSATYVSGGTYDIVTTAAIPAWAGVGTDLKVGAYMPDTITIKKCDFKNNAGCDVILFNDNATLMNNTHERCMFPAIYMGSNNSTAGVCGSNIDIVDCNFSYCGWMDKNGHAV